jgi:hypothetical protein
MGVWFDPAELLARVSERESFDDPFPLFRIILRDSSGECAAMVAWLESGFSVASCAVTATNSLEKQVNWSQEQRSEKEHSMLRVKILKDVDCEAWAKAPILLKGEFGIATLESSGPTVNCSDLEDGGYDPPMEDHE